AAFFFMRMRRPPTSPLFPYTTLFRSARWSLPPPSCPPDRFAGLMRERGATHTFCVPVHLADVLDASPSLPSALRYVLLGAAPAPDRKSTRLNSSHVKISYAVFCLKKK